MSEASRDAVLDVSEGDMRRAINLLQSAVQFNPGDSVVRPEAVLEVAGALPSDALTKLWLAIEKNRFDMVQKEVESVVAQVCGECGL